MPRKKISEFRAKTMLYGALELPYGGRAVNTLENHNRQLTDLSDANKFVVKVDQATKARYKKGLMQLNIARADVGSAIQELAAKGYDWVVVEPYSTHDMEAERYIAFKRERDGIDISIGQQGGVEVESSGLQQHFKVDLNNQNNIATIATAAGCQEENIRRIITLMNDTHISFMEINPYIVYQGSLHALDCAIEVDDAGEFFTDAWTSKDFRNPPRAAATPEEKDVEVLSENSPASFRLEVINPDGAIFLLLSGGGASVVVADEIYARGKGDLMANYGEYSGNPSTEETRIYTEAIISLLLRSKAPQKLLIIGGAVANFTDIANTFKGIIAAIDARATEIQQQHIVCYVRRGGPREEIGLKAIEQTLHKYGLLGAVYNAKKPIAKFVGEALESLS